MGTNSTLLAGIGRMILRAVLPAVAIIIAASIIPLPAVCGDNPSSVTESSRTYKDPACNFMVRNLENEIAETTTSLKICGDQSSYAEPSADKSKECAKYARKLRLTKANLLHVREQCDKGLTPDSLPKVADDPDLGVPCSQCGADKPLPKDPPAKDLTGLPIGDKVLNLKAGDPMLASVAGKSKAPAAITGEVPPVGEPYVDCKCPDNSDLGWMYLSECTAKRATSCGTVQPICSASQDLVNGNCVPKCTGGQSRNAAGTCECPAGQIFSAGKCGCPSGQTLTAEGKCVASGGGDGGIVQPPATSTGSKPWYTKLWDGIKAIGKWIRDKILKPIGDFFVGVYHKIKGDTEKCDGNRFNPNNECCMNGKLVEKCGGECYNPETECCSGGKPASKQACSGGSVGINGPADLIIAKIPANSPRISLQVTFSCPCPDKITWSSSSDKIKFVGATNQTTVQLIAAIESQAEGDITINVNVAGSSAQKNLTVRRPVLLSHPVLEFKRDDAGVVTVLRTNGNFYWALIDHFGKPLSNALVTEDVTKNPASSGGFVWSDQHYSANTVDGKVIDRYMIVAQTTQLGEINALLDQKLTVAGWIGTSQVTITANSIFGTSPVELK